VSTTMLCLIAGQLFLVALGGWMAGRRMLAGPLVLLVNIGLVLFNVAAHSGWQP
jgi:hypothetical protein